MIDDIGQQVAAQHGITLYASVRDALTLGGGRGGFSVGGETKDDIARSTRVGVDAVVLIAEHGEAKMLVFGPGRQHCKTHFDSDVGLCRRFSED